jgi:hypothetical protein
MVVAETAASVPEIRRLAGESDRVGSICSGTPLLAEAGLLDGRQATTHWAVGDLLAREQAKRLLESTDEPLDRIATRVGQGTPETPFNAGTPETARATRVPLLASRGSWRAGHRRSRRPGSPCCRAWFIMIGTSAVRRSMRSCHAARCPVIGQGR